MVKQIEITNNMIKNKYKYVSNYSKWNKLSSLKKV